MSTVAMKTDQMTSYATVAADYIAEVQYVFHDFIYIIHFSPSAFLR